MSVMATNVYRLLIPGRPVPAPRMTAKEIAMATRGRGRNAARIQRYHQWRDDVATVAAAERVRPIEGPVRIVVRVFLSGAKRGDASNYLKAAEDALNGIAYHDDRQIVDARVEIQPDTWAMERMEIEIARVEEGAG